MVSSESRKTLLTKADKLQPPRANDTDEEGEAEEGGDDETYEAEDAHP